MLDRITNMKIVYVIPLYQINSDFLDLVGLIAYRYIVFLYFNFNVFFS